jgi:hypothetical protein
MLSPTLRPIFLTTDIGMVLLSDLRFELFTVTGEGSEEGEGEDEDEPRDTDSNDEDQKLAPAPPIFFI